MERHISFFFSREAHFVFGVLEIITFSPGYILQLALVCTTVKHHLNVKAQTDVVCVDDVNCDGS